MAGIGFELRKLLQRDSYFALVRAYAYAGLISSGPWVLSIVGLAVIGVMSVNIVVPNLLVTQFQVSVTYLIAGSLILTGVVQLSFTRWVSDQLFARRADIIVPNFAGVLLVTNLGAGTLAAGASAAVAGASHSGPRHSAVIRRRGRKRVMRQSVSRPGKGKPASVGPRLARRCRPRRKAVNPA